MGTFASAARTTGINAARNAALDAITPSLDGGSLRIYSGTAPADADAALGGAVLLAQLPLNADSFAAAASGVATANAITADASADATGTPTFFRLLTSASAVVYQGTAAATGAELNLSGLSGGQIVAGGSVSVTSLTITQPASYT